MSHVESVGRRVARITAVDALAIATCTTLTNGSAGAIVNGTDSTERYPFMASIPESAEARAARRLLRGLADRSPVGADGGPLRAG
ncbi:hypothetical protein L1085_001120 [Streptomyces sp. MSC1_001]|uniref:hypothetical protein n=1 Tax=Streptomyces sp. MSC1_001 TaxID=2909263 RepID=UPI0035AF8777